MIILKYIFQKRNLFNFVQIIGPVSDSDDQVTWQTVFCTRQNNSSVDVQLLTSKAGVNSSPVTGQAG
jgi:hypothetical protein